MGMEITLERYGVQVIGREFQFDGQMEPVGPVLDFLNTANRSTFPLYDVKVFPLFQGGPLTGITRPEITVSNRELGLIYFVDQDLRHKIQYIQNFDQVIAYTPHAVLRGRFHRGAETRWRDLFDVMAGSFLAMTEVSVFPVRELPTSFPRKADLLIVNRYFVSLYHPE